MTLAGTCIDTNVLVDVLEQDPEQGSPSAKALDAAAMRGALVVGPVTYAELLVAFARRVGERHAREDLDLFLDQSGIELVPMPEAAPATAGLAYARYLSGRDVEKVECPGCGAKTRFQCPSCAKPVRWHVHIMSDFLVGAHARHTTGVLLTRDRHLHRRMPGLKVMSP